MERLRFADSAAFILKDGAKVKIRRVDAKRPAPGGTALHEAAHIVASGEIVRATIHPHGNALGTTEPVKMTATAAAAAEAMGYSGTGHDMFLTQHYLKVDPAVAKSAARAALSGKEEEMHEVAVALEEKGTIYQTDVDNAFEKAGKKRQGIEPFEITVEMPKGKSYSFVEESYRGEIKLEDLF